MNSNHLSDEHLKHAVIQWTQKLEVKHWQKCIWRAQHPQTT